MSIEVRMVAVSPSMTEGTLARWVKKVGETVNVGDILAEIETDKALVDLEATESGTLAKTLVADGASAVPVGSVIALLAVDGEDVAAVGMQATQPGGPIKDASAAPSAMNSQGAQLTPVADKVEAASGSRIFASPLARRLAKERGVSLEGLVGSGPRGRIIKADVMAAPVATTEPPARSSQEPGAPHKAVGVAPSADFDEVAHTGMRKVIAQRLTESKQQIPHFYLTVDCNLDPLLALRAEISAALPDKKISVNDFVIKAAALALRKVPDANSSWGEAAVRRYRDVDISVAVATPGGLMTPIIRKVDEKSVGAVSGEMKSLAERARAGKLLPADYQGGGFTISNLGMFGIKQFSAIINPPQACILAVGAGEKRAIVKDDAVVVATVMTCTLSVDHRVVDGAVGAEFLKAFREAIESPMSLLV